MSTQVDNSFKTFLASGAGVSAFTLVSVQSDGSITAAAYAAKPVGVTQEDAPAGYYCNVKLFHGAGTYMIGISGTAITQGTTYSTASGGLVGAATGTTAPAYFIGLTNSSGATNGIVLEFAIY